MKSFYTALPVNGGYKAALMSWDETSGSYIVAGIASHLRRHFEDAFDLAQQSADNSRIEAHYMRDCPYPFHHSVR